MILDKIKLVNYILTEMPDDSKIDLANRYEKLFSALSSNNKDYIMNNIESYQVLLNKSVFITAMQYIQSNRLGDLDYCRDIITKSIAENNGSNLKAFKELCNKYSGLVGSTCGIKEFATQVSPDILEQALKVFDLQSEPLEVEEISGEEDIEDISDLFDFDEDIFGDEQENDSVKHMNEDISDFDDVSEFINDDSIVEDFETSIEDFETSIEDFETSIEDFETSTEDFETSTYTNDYEEDADTIIDFNSTRLYTNKAFKAKVSELENGMLWSSINAEIDNVVTVLQYLYESGFNSMPIAGILLNNGNEAPLRTVIDNKLVNNADSGTANDFRIMTSIFSIIPSIFTAIPLNSEIKEVVPPLSIIKQSSGVLDRLHCQFMTANIHLSTGKTSIHQWITDTQLEGSECSTAEEWLKTVNKNTNKLTNFKIVSKWYRWCVKNIICEACIREGVKDLSSMDTLDDILITLGSALKRAVVIAERRQDSKTKQSIETIVRISCGKEIDINSIKDNILKSFNKGTNSIEVRTTSIKAYKEAKVLNLSVVFDKEEADKMNLFAKDILEDLKNSGNVPSWDHALLGKSEDGTYLYWDDFMGSAEPYKRCYTIYAGSRSGKGVMTSTLITSALADGKQVFYTDGKPENGVCLGKIAWDEGKEAYVFDGQPTGAKPFIGPMENYSNVRQPEEVVEFINKCPKCLFETKDYFNNETQKKFLGVMRYLKSLDLCFTTIFGRSGALSNISIDTDNWQVWIFDEVTKMADNEKDILEIFGKYLRAKSGEAEPDSSKDINAKYRLNFRKFKNLNEVLDPNSSSYDAGVHYIYQFKTWCNEIVNKVKGAAVINLGKAKLNLIFIFQEATWIAKDNNTSTLCKVITGLRSTKIVGANALENNCGEYGKADSKNSSWYTDKVQKGWWAISSASDLDSCTRQYAVGEGGITLFRPYKVWTIPLIKGTEDLDPNGDPNDTKYVGGYVRSMLSAKGLNAADIIESAYLYADNLIKTLGVAGTLKEYIYDCTNFASLATPYSYSELKQDLANSESSIGDTQQTQDDIYSAFNGEIKYENTNNTQFVNNANEDSTIQNQVNQGDNDKVPNRLLITKNLIQLNLSDSALSAYFNNILLPYIQNKLPGLSVKDAAHNNSNGLLRLAFALSNIHYCSTRGIVDIDDMKKLIFNVTRVNDILFIISEGMLGDYDNGTLQYDKVPNTKDLSRYIHQYNENININMSEKIAFGSGDESGYMAMDQQPIMDNISKPEDTPPIQNNNYRVKPDGSIEIIENSRRTIKLNKYDPRKYREVKLSNYTFMKKMKKRMFESKNGISYEFKNRWDHVLNILKLDFPDLSRIHTITLENNMLLVNDSEKYKGNSIDLSGVLGGDYNIELSDIVFFKPTFKKLPMLRKIVIEEDLFYNMVREYGRNAVEVIFNKYKNLLIIEVHGSDVKIYERNKIEEQKKELEEKENLEEAKRKIEATCASKNPRLHKKSPGYVTKVFDFGHNTTGKAMHGSWDITKNFYSQAKKNAVKNNPSISKTLGWSLLGTAMIGVSAAFALPHGIGSAIKGISNTFK